MMRNTRWLVGGAAAGILLAAAGLLAPRRPDPLPAAAGVAARVNGEPIAVSDYQRALAALAADRRGAISEDERRRVLDRLIDEELLVQRGLELGLPRHDAKVRGDLTAALIASVVTDAEEVAPGSEDLEEFYGENREFFARPGRVHARQIFFRVRSAEQESAARTRALDAAARWGAGEPFERVRDALGDEEIASLPDGAVPAEKLLDYVGPTVLRALLRLETGAISEPIRSGSGLHVLQVVERSAPTVPPFAEIRTQVEGEWRRRTGERALRAYLDDLRARATLEIPGPNP